VDNSTFGAPRPIRPGSILVGVDGSNDGLRAVDYAAAEAQLRKTALHIVTALPLAAATAFGLALPPLTDQTVVAAAATAAAARRALAPG
jgi:nucleotide-binding universal stress UspA family protein